MERIVGEDETEDSDPQSSTSTNMEERKELPKKIKILTAVAIFYGNITFGCAFNTYGPALTSLQNKYETDDATISKVLTILTGCYMIGALCGGFIFNYVNRQLAAITLLLTMSAIMIVTPHCPTMTTFFISAAVMGLCIGVYDTAQFVWMMEMFQKDCPPYVQGQNFCYALGSNLASLIMAPFLDEQEDDLVVSSTTSGTFHQNEFDNDIIVMSAKKDSDSELFIPYTIVGLLLATSAMYQIILFIFLRYFKPPPEIDDAQTGLDSEEEMRDEIPIIGSWPWPKLRMVILCCCFYGFYSGMEMCTMQFFSKFAQNSDLKLSESQAAYVLTGMTAAFAVGRGIAIIAVFKISTQLILCGNIVLVIVANILLVSWAKSTLSVLWASGILFGLGFSSMYASFSAYAERYLTFTNFVGSLMIICGSGVAAIYPLVVGSFIEKNPVVLSYTAFFSIGMILFAFGSASYFTFKSKKRY